MNARRADRVTGRRGYGSILIVNALFNKTSRLSLLVDTGTAMTVITPQMTNDLGFDLANPTRWMEMTSVHQTVRAPIIRLDTVQVGGQQVNGLEVAVLSLPANMRVDGLLGINFLRNFRVTFEFDQATLILRPIN